MKTFFLVTALSALFLFHNAAGQNARFNKHATECVSGFTAGFLTAFICFYLLPDTFNQTGVLFTFIFVAFGVLAVNLLKRPSKLLFLFSSLALAYFSAVNAAGALSCAALSLASGTLLSFSCNAIIPDDKATLTSLSALPGFILGVLVLTIL